MKKGSFNFLEIKNDVQYRNSILSSITNSFPSKSDGSKIDGLEHLKGLLNYTIDNSDMFDVDVLKGSIYDGDDDILDLVLPSVARVYNKIFTKPPPLFIQNHDDGSRLKLFQLYFDIDGYLLYLIDMLEKSKDSLRCFDNLDRSAETVSLIVDNYISGLVVKVLDSYDINADIKMLERDRKIDDIIND